MKKIKVFVLEDADSAPRWTSFAQNRPEGTYYKIIGTTEIEVEEPKKTVTKEALGARTIAYDYNKAVEWLLPKEAKNIKCTYDIDE